MRLLAAPLQTSSYNRTNLPPLAVGDGQPALESMHTNLDSGYMLIVPPARHSSDREGGVQ